MRVHALPDQRITLFDATIAAVAANLGLEVWTYNHHFDVMRVPVWRM
jgi:predicted nucleic acid-binding protein